jgi:NAD(P)-dependent dehydrogenase (short-subunit alcohol dehydrogenase family)
MKVAIVTGSSSGIGLEAAAELASKDYHVVYACRNEEKAKLAMDQATKANPNAKTTFLQLDTGKMKSVKSFAESFLRQFDRLDVLVNNAGSGYFLKKDRITEDGLEAFFATNYLGAFLLTKLLKDTLKKSSGRVVNVTSIEHWEGSYDFEKVVQKTGPKSYATSKLMMMLMAFELCRQGEIQAVAVNPGAVNSGIWWYLRGFMKFLYGLILPLVFLSPKQGCQTIVHGATAESLTSSKDYSVYLTPYKQRSWCPYYSDTLGPFNGAAVGMGDPKAYREEPWKKLWEFSEAQVKPFL